LKDRFAAVQGRLCATIDLQVGELRGWRLRLALLFDRLEGCGNHFRASPILPFGGLPPSLIEAPDDHQVLATPKEIMLNLGQFPKGDNVNSFSTSLPGRGMVQGLPCEIL
jgi:hypothetical protein